MDSDLEITILCALSYALPRETCAGESVRNCIKKEWKNFPRPCDGPMMFRDVVCALEEGRAGAEMDRLEWFNFLAWLRENMTPIQYDEALQCVRYLRPCIPEVEAALNAT